MYIAPKSIKAPTAPKLQYWPDKPVLLNGGLNLVDKEWKVSDNQTSKVLNMWFKDGELSKRWGQEYVEDSIEVETPTFSTYKRLFDGFIIKHCGTKLYKQDPATETTTEIHTGLTAAKGSFFKFSGKLYYLQAGLYLEYDGTTVSEVTPYITTVIINRTPTGGGEVNEDYNRIGAGFTNKFNGNGSAVAYTLTDTDLDVTEVTCTVGGATKTESVDFTVNRTTGVVTFGTAPASGTNNVILTAYKTVQDDIDTILNCKYSIPFGGQNDNRLFMGGNGTGFFYWTGISADGIDASYFAYNNYNVVGNPDENITGFRKHYETLCIFKEREIYGETYFFDGTTGIFNTFTINANIGCDCPDTLQNIMNNIVWLNSYAGPQILVSTIRENQRNVLPLGRNINPRLLKETTLTTATSVDFNGKYWLCVGDKVYLWDYFISPYVDLGNPEESGKRLSWWYFDNISATGWITDGLILYYQTTGKIVKFHTTSDNLQFYDFGEGISALYRYPYRAMGGGIFDFTVTKGFVGVRGDTRTSFLVTYYTSDDINGDSATETIEVGSFIWSNFAWNTFTWDVMGPLQDFVLMPYEKNIRYFGAEFSNDEAGRDMNISSVTWEYIITKKIK